MENELIRNSLDALIWDNHSTDELASRTIGAIANARLKTDAYYLEPKEPFDQLYFYAVAVKSMSTYFGHTPLYPLPVYQSAFGFNYPDIDDERWCNSEFVRSGVASIFLDTIRRESVSGGDRFDVGYAFSVMYYAIDHTTKYVEFAESILSWIGAGKGKSCESMWQIVNDPEFVEKYWG